MDWDRMRVILALHRAGSLRGAAEALGVTHATVARALVDAETSLGTRLFDRGRGGLVPTQPGETLLPHAEAMERQMLQVGRLLGGLDQEPRGTVRISAPPSFASGLLAPLLADFTPRHPEIAIEIIATNERSDLGRHEADVSIRAAFSVEDDVVGRRAVTYVNAAFASPGYLAAHPDLAATGGRGAHVLGWGGDGDWLADTPLPHAEMRHALPEVVLQVAAAAQGLGVAWVPAFLGDAHAGIVRVPGAAPRPSRSIWLLLHGDLRRTVRVRAFVDFAAAWIAARREVFTA